MAKLNKKSIALLGTIIAAMGNATAPYHMVSPAEAKQLTDAKLVESNAEIADGEKVATRATEAGIAEFEKLKTETGTGTAPALPTVPVVQPGTEGALSLDLGAFVKRSRSQSSYDFDGMNPGAYFFVEATEARPKPSKSLASTVSAANKKWADKPEAEQRTYVVADFAAGESKGGYTAEKAGALVVRTK